MQRVLFFHQGKFSHTAEFTLAGLKHQLASVEFRTVDIHQHLRSRRRTLLVGGLHALRTYGGDLLHRRRDLDDAFFGTRYMFDLVRQIALDAHRAWPADASFQTQSMYDCSAPGIPNVIYTDHTYESCKEYPDYARALWNPTRPDWLIDLERTIYRNAACILTMSRNVTRTLLDRYDVPASKVSCVRTGYNAGQEKLQRIPCDMRRYQSRTVLFVGLDWHRKGGPQLLAAFRLLRRQLPDARLVIVGPALDVQQENVEFVGPVPLSQLPHYYTNASVCCIPSRMEPMGIAWLEAMAAGLPAVGLRLGAALDFILPEQTGLLVEPDDINGLTRALADLLTNPKKCRTLGEAGRQLVCRDYTWDQTCRLIADRVRRVLSQPIPASRLQPE